MDFPPNRAGTLSHATLPTSWILLPLRLFLPPFLSFSLPLGIQFLLCARLCVRSHAMLPVGRSGEDGIIHRFSLSPLCLSVWLIFSSEHAGQVPPTQFKHCFARLVGWLVGRRTCPLNSQPPRLLHRPSNPGHPAPSGRGSWGRTPKSEWLFQASVAVETGCTGLGGPLHHPSATQPMGSELHPRRLTLTAARKPTNEW